MNKWLPGLLSSLLGVMLAPIMQPMVESQPTRLFEVQRLSYTSSVQDAFIPAIAPEEIEALEQVLIKPPAMWVSLLNADADGKVVPKFPSLAEVEQQAEAKSLAKQAAAAQAEVAAETEALESGSVKAPAKETLEAKVDRLENAMVLLVTALSRSNQLSTADATSIAAKVAAKQGGKIEVSESGMVTTQRVVNPQAAQANYAADPVITCRNCGCNCVADANGCCPCCRNHTGVSRSMYAGYSGSGAGGGSTGNYQGGGSTGDYQAGGGSTGNAGQYNAYAGYNAYANYNARQPAYNQPVYNRPVYNQPVNYLPASAAQSQPAQQERRGLFGRRNAPQRSNCSYQLGSDGQWYEVCRS